MRLADRCIARRPMPASAPAPLVAPLPPGRGGTTGKVAGGNDSIMSFLEISRPAHRTRVQHLETRPRLGDDRTRLISATPAVVLAIESGSPSLDGSPLLDDRKWAALTLETSRSLAANAGRWGMLLGDLHDGLLHGRVRRRKSMWQGLSATSSPQRGPASIKVSTISRC